MLDRIATLDLPEARALMDRRHFLQTTLTASAATWLGSQHDALALQEASQLGATRSVVPVVGDGTWIWQGPPPPIAAISNVVRFV